MKKKERARMSCSCLSMQTCSLSSLYKFNCPSEPLFQLSLTFQIVGMKQNLMDHPLQQTKVILLGTSKKIQRMVKQVSCCPNDKIHYWLRLIWVSLSFHEYMVVSMALALLTISLSHLCKISSFTGSTESLRTMFSDACAKMTKEDAQ